MSWGCQGMLRSGVAWMWHPADGNLYLCLGATSLLVPETLKFKALKRDFQLPTTMGI